MFKLINRFFSRTQVIEERDVNLKEFPAELTTVAPPSRLKYRLERLKEAVRGRPRGPKLEELRREIDEIENYFKQFK